MIRKSLPKLALAATGLFLALFLSSSEAALISICHRTCGGIHRYCTRDCYSGFPSQASIFYCLESCDASLFFCEASCDNP